MTSAAVGNRLANLGKHERTRTLRDRCIARKDFHRLVRLNESAAVSARSLQNSESEASWQVRKGLLCRDRLASLGFFCDDLELLIGRPVVDEDGEEERAAALHYLSQYPSPGGQTGHCEPDFETVLSEGIDGVAGAVRKRLGEAQDEKRAVYTSFLLALDGLSSMAGNAALAAVEAGEDASPERRSELETMASACQWVAHGPPRTFHEALQLIWFVLLGIMHGDQVGLVVPGHLDRWLGPFYETDAAAGRLTRERALVLLECFYILINEYIPDGLAMSVMGGGRDAHGRDVTNEVSFLCLEALEHTGLIYPTAGVCWHEGTPPALTELAIRLIGKGRPTAAFFGDETIQRGLRELGVPPDEACHYTNSTCVEITPARGSNVWVASPYFSTCQLLLDEIASQMASGPAGSFEEFLESYQERLSREIAAAVQEQNRLRQKRRERGRKPLQSVFTRDCIARGRDIDDGGARYNWVECSFVGLANLADSLHAIREEVYASQRLTLPALKQVLDTGFEGNEHLRARLLNGLPKYGQGIPETDALVGDLVGFFKRECAKHRVEPDDSPFVPGGFCWIMHEVLGRECGATPDGRAAGTPFADGCGPAQGRETLGPTAAIRSTTSWDHAPMIGGLAFNMKFSARLFERPEGYAALRSLVLTFLRQGGFEIQVNATGAGTLRKARAHPDAHRDLVVRIGGYCDYFTRLSPEMQEEIILRTEFGEG